MVTMLLHIHMRRDMNSSVFMEYVRIHKNQPISGVVIISVWHQQTLFLFPGKSIKLNPVSTFTYRLL